MENRTYNQVIGNRAAPYITGLARQCATFTHFDDLSSSFPSYPEYIAATSGQNARSMPTARALARSPACLP